MRRDDDATSDPDDWPESDRNADRSRFATTLRHPLTIAVTAASVAAAIEVGIVRLFT